MMGKYTTGVAPCLFDPTTGAFMGVIDKAGNEVMVATLASPQKQPFVAVVSATSASTPAGGNTTYFPTPAVSQPGVAGGTFSSPLSVTFNSSGTVTLPAAGNYLVEFSGCSTGGGSVSALWIFATGPTAGVVVWNPTSTYLAQGTSGSSNPTSITGATLIVASQAGSFNLGFGSTNALTNLNLFGTLKITRVDNNA